MNISEEEEMMTNAKRVGFVLEERMADIGIEISSVGIIVDTMGRLKYFTDIKEINDLPETISIMMKIFKDEKEKTLIAVNKVAFEIVFKLDTLKKSPIEVAKKLFERFIKKSKMGWIKELEIIHMKLTLLEEWPGSIGKMKRKWIGMTTDTRPAETVEKKQLKSLINQEMSNEVEKRLKRTVSNYNWKDANCWSQVK